MTVGAQATRRPYLWAVVRMRSTSRNESASGFSLYTCFPASSARTVISECALGLVKLRMISTSSRLNRAAASSSAAIPKRPMVNRHKVGVPHLPPPTQRCQVPLLSLECASCDAPNELFLEHVVNDQ